MNYTPITSRKNDNIIWASKLSDKKMRDKENLFFTEGWKLLEEALNAKLKVQKLFFTESALQQYSTLLGSANAQENFLVTSEVFDKITSENAPQGIFAVIRKKEHLSFSKESLAEGGFVILEDIQNPQNLGAIIRSAYCLGSSKIILSKSCADIYNPKTLRSSMGSVFKAQMGVYNDLVSFIEGLKSEGNRVICTSLHAKSHTLGNFKFKNSDSIVIGNEGNGISENILNTCTDSIIIPMLPDAESLNASNATSIILWEMNKDKFFS